MPKGRPRKNPEQQTSDQNKQAPLGQEATVEQEAPGTEQTAAISGGSPEAAAPEPAEQPAPEQTGPELNEEPLTLAAYLMDSVKEFMRDFGINGHRPESVFAAIKGVAGQDREDQPVQADRQMRDAVPRDPDWPTSVAEYFEYFQLDIHPQEMVDDFISMMNGQELEYQSTYGLQQNESPMEPPVPLSVRINSLEMDGDTRAFATAEYGDLTIGRIRVKEDGYGTMSVNMPKFRDAGGWKETCRFDTVEARNRLTSATLDAYQHKLAQLQGQAPAESQVSGEAPAPDQDMDQEDVPNMEEQEQGGFGMSMTQC